MRQTERLIFLGSVMVAVPILWMTSAVAGDNLHVSTATYLSGPADDAAGGVAIAPDQTVVYGGTLDGVNTGGVTPTNLLGGGNGVVVRLDKSGTNVLSVTRVGRAICDLDVGADGRIVTAAEGIGPVVLDATGSSVSWQASVPNISRVSVGQNGYVAALSNNGYCDHGVYVYDSQGNQIGYGHLGDSYVEDVAIDSGRNQVVVTGFNNKWYNSSPVQVPFMRAYPYDFSIRNWTDYDWSGTQVGATQNFSVADSRGYRVTIGRDGMLYFAGESHGGNSTYLYDPQVVDRLLSSDEWIKFDKYNHPWQTKSEAKSVFGRFDPATGQLEKIEWLFSRLGNNDGNSLNLRGITADQDGRIYLTGKAYYKIKDRDLHEIDGIPVGGYQGGEAIVAVISPDFLTREVWTALTGENEGGSQSGTGMSIAVLGDFWAAGVTMEAETGQLITTPNALQPVRSTGMEGYLLVVPEPSALLLLGVGLIAILRRRLAAR